MGAEALLGLPTLIGGGSALTAAEAGSTLLTGAFGGLLIRTGYLVGKGINQRAKDLRTDDGIDARNYGVNKLPKGWSSNDYNVSGQRGSLVVDNLGRRRISIDHTNGKTTYYSATGNVLAGNSQAMTNKEATDGARSLGYDKVNEKSHGQPVFKTKKGSPKYISPDVDSHNGGSWKGADTIKDLGNRKTRSGTYDENLKRIGD